MANEGTEKATPLKRRKEKEKGNLAKSKDLNSFLALASFMVIVFLYAKPFINDVVSLIDNQMTMISSGADKEAIILRGFKDVGILLLPVFAIVMFFQIINYVMQVGFLFSPKIIVPDPKKINPATYFKNLFTKKTVVDLVKATLLLFGLAAVLFVTFKNAMPQMVDMVWLPWVATLNIIFTNFKFIFGMLMVVIFIEAIIDYVLQKHDHEKKIRMKKEDVKREHKDNDGDPMMRARKKEFMYAMMENDASKTVPEATFILNNPTHISVAVRYEKGRDSEPIVVAKGEDRVALYIRSIAKEHNIPMVENKPLARAMYFNVEVGEPIHEEMYEAVIEVLKYLISTNQIENNY